MQKTLSLIVVFAFLIVAFSPISCGKSDTAVQYGDEKGQILCPVMGNPIDKQYYADYQGKRIYFCCEGCIEEFKKDPEKYMKKLEGVALDESPAVKQE